MFAFVYESCRFFSHAITILHHVAQSGVQVQDESQTTTEPSFCRVEGVCSCWGRAGGLVWTLGEYYYPCLSFELGLGLQGIRARMCFITPGSRQRHVRALGPEIRVAAPDLGPHCKEFTESGERQPCR